MKTYYGDVYVTVRKRVTLEIDLEKDPTKVRILTALQDGDYTDITDEEYLEFVSVESVAALAPLLSEEDEGE
jgi:hypothetical protein